MIISGLRTSCAITVERRPSDDSRSLCDISRWKRAIDSVSVLNVVASSRASSSSRSPRRTIFFVRSPVAATSRMMSVIVASGRVIVRATAKLRSMASPAATTAVIASSVRIARRNRSCSVRERRISATGAAARSLVTDADESGSGSAMYSSVLSVTLRASSARRIEIDQRGAVFRAAASSRGSARSCRMRSRCR